MLSLTNRFHQGARKCARLSTHNSCMKSPNSNSLRRNVSYISHKVPVSMNTTIHYLEYPKVGSANAQQKKASNLAPKTLINLHGSYQTAFTFDDFIQCMDESRPMHPLRVISVDFRGHGDSSWSTQGKYTLQILREDISKLIDSLDVDNYYVLGEGLGSLVALDLASSRGFTADLNGVIAVEVPSSPKKMQIFDKLRYNASFSSFEQFVDFVMQMNPNTTERSVRKRLEMAIREDPTSGTWQWKRDPRFNFESAILQSEIEMLVEKIRGLASDTRVLVVRGENSDVSSPKSTERLLETLNHDVTEGPKATAVTLPSAGHILHGDNPKRLAETVLRFMDLL